MLKMMNFVLTSVDSQYGRERKDLSREGDESLTTPQTRSRAYEVDCTKPERGVQGLSIRISSFRKDGGGIECDDVDTTHLLRN